MKVYVRPRNRSCSLARRSCAPIGRSRLTALGSARYVFLLFGLEHSLPLAPLGIPSALLSGGLARSRADRVRCDACTYHYIAWSIDRSLARSLGLVLSARFSALLVRASTRLTSFPSFAPPCHHPPLAPPFASLGSLLSALPFAFLFCIDVFLVARHRATFGILIFQKSLAWKFWCGKEFDSLRKMSSAPLIYHSCAVLLLSMLVTCDC